jgi:hypothetical protein
MIDSINFNNFSEIQANNSNNNRSIEHKLINPFQEALRQLKIKMNSLIQSKNNNNTDNIIQKIVDNNLYVSSEFKSRRFIKKDISKSNIKKKDVGTNNNIKENNLNLSSINSFPKINIQNKIIQNKNYSQNLNEISSHINIPNITNGNNNYNNMILLGKKRNLDDKEESEKESLYKDIKSIYNKYKNDKNNNEDNEISMYDVDTGFFEKNETVVIGNPVCIIYFNRKIITSIYLIREKTTVCNNKEIIEVFNKLKNDLNEHILKKKI